MLNLKRAVMLSPPIRLWRSAALALRGVKLSPFARILGSVNIGRGASVGWRCLLDASPKATIRLAPMVWLSDQVEIETGSEVSIGIGTTIQRRCTVNGDVRIGTKCILAPNVFISSGSHPFRDMPWIPIRNQEALRRTNGIKLPDRPVRIDDDCWIGTNAVICPGVRIGKGAVVGANSVVTHDVRPFTVVAGTPAREIGHRLDWEPPRILDCAEPKHLPYITSPVPWNGAFAGDHGQIQHGWPLEVWLSGEKADVAHVHGVAEVDSVLVIGDEKYQVSHGPFTVQCNIAFNQHQRSAVSLCIYSRSPIRITRITL